MESLLRIKNERLNYEHKLKKVIEDIIKWNKEE